MDVLQELGKVALGSRLRRLGDVFACDAAKIFQMYGVDIQPKWFPVFYLLSQTEESSITAMAADIGCSHPVVSQAVKEMTRAGLIETGKSSEDGRMNVVKLSDAGRALIPGLEAQMQDVTESMDELQGQMQHNLLKAIEETEYLLEEKSLHDRVLEQRKRRESQRVEILDYTPEFHDDFKRLNYEWIEKFFTVEDADRELLEHPNERILNPGGAILLARYEGEIVGVCALFRKDDETLELAKMAVTPKVQGRSIGWTLGCAAVDKARSLGAKKLHIDSNTKLKAAMKLYAKMGFVRVVGPPSPYEKCNIQLEKILD
ncbi:bifunctional helix-turn-helix transcriptional regulator/GNAT family N-acetyltransferase [Oceanidesulfovibrio marinus]|uniref:MarR family transcriptional regulator n=1 Tax=Oceanidesulfovibrio marinus TaxID=370038 RepID=A0ABX6NKS4_9BACT|nr:helix-turn-helix domain-containing GNAT family N-acetyltransferase [Oceanidesulfovibrio marinus]QJT10628.1 MarR family transcriptional regulator [Oceanidesulfovibrio marinus]